MSRSRGFTLFELIILVVIIAVLAAVVMPVFPRAREAARKATCLNNLRVIGLSCLMYAADNDEMLPSCVADDQNGTAHAVAGAYKNWTVEAMRRDIANRYGRQYVGNTWMGAGCGSSATGWRRTTLT